MDSCPTEVIERIISFACLSDLSTGRSLLLVSRWMHEISTPFQWQSLTLSGIAEVCAFSEKLLSDSPVRRPIYHLFISDAASSSSFNRWDRAPAETIEQLHAIEEKERQAWKAAQYTILEYAAPTLQSLTFLAFDPRNSARCVGDVFNHVYPNLFELTIRVPPLQPLFASQPINLTDYRALREMSLHSQLQPSKRHLLPKLERLHLAGDFRDSTSAHSRVRAIASGVTHLRLSGIFSLRFVNELHADLAQRGILYHEIPVGALNATFSAAQVTRDYILPTSVECLVIQASDPAYCKVWGIEDGADILNILDRFNRSMDFDPQFMYLPPMESGYYGYRIAKADWLSRVNGGEGCWAKPVGETYATRQRSAISATTASEGPRFGSASLSARYRALSLFLTSRR